MNKKTLAFIGGDMRQAAAAMRLSELGFSVSAWGIPGVIPDAVNRLDSIESAFGADVLILPLPVSKDGISVNCTGDFADSSPKIEQVFCGAGRSPVLAGSISPRIADQAARMGVRLYDYYDSEELMINNAYLTAEGAISLAMNELNVSLLGARVCVIGYGRIGKFLARMLSAIGASVTVAARKGTDIAYAAGFGLDTLRITYSDGQSSLCSLGDYRIIFNTAPYRLLDAQVLACISKEALIIDLASAPGGFDPEAARHLGRRVISAPGLPGKYAPLTAGRFVGDAIATLLPKIN